MADLVEQLRGRIDRRARQMGEGHYLYYGVEDGNLDRKAAAKIERLQTALREARQAIFDRLPELALNIIDTALSPKGGGSDNTADQSATEANIAPAAPDLDPGSPLSGKGE